MRLPDLALDGHAHVFEPHLSMEPGRRYTPQHKALLSDYANHLIANNLDGGLLVQPSFLGTDNSYLLAALQAGNERLFQTTDGQERKLTFRGVVTLGVDTPHEQIARMHEVGVIGMRFNLYGKSEAYRFDVTPWIDLLKHVSDLGWHIDLHCEDRLLARALPQLLDHARTITVDHFGLPDPAAPLDGPGQQAILASPRERVFVKASGPYRVFRNQRSNIAAQMCTSVFAQLLQERGPDQLIWGSDWPWTQFEGEHSFGDTRLWLDNWLAQNFDRASYRAPELMSQSDDYAIGSETKTFG